jgi:hypothetical protein
MLSELFLQVCSSLVAKWRTGRWDLSELIWKVIFQAVMLSHRGNRSRAITALAYREHVGFGSTSRPSIGGAGPLARFPEHGGGVGQIIGLTERGAGHRNLGVRAAG